MNEINNTDNIEIASIRLERAMTNLEAVVNHKSDQNKIITNLQSENEKNTLQTSKLKADYENVARRERKLDKSTAEVSKRIVDVMETIKSVLAK